jgi:hypothetical protein
VLEPFPWRAREEARVHEAIASALHVVHDAAERCALRDRLLQLAARLDDRAQVAQRRLRDRG